MKSRAAILLIWLGCLIAASIALGWLIVAGLADPRSNRARRLAIGFDQTVNAAAGGSEDETISSRAHRESQQGRRWAICLCRLLDVIDPDHCAKSAGV